MRRYRELLLVCMILLLTGCGLRQENPYRVDTVVQIPVDPTEAPTEQPAEPAEDTQPPAVTESVPEETEKPAASAGKGTSSSGGKKPSTGKKPSGSSVKETVPPVSETEPETQPPTDPPTQPPYDPSSYQVGSLEYAILDAINACRGDEGLAALTMSRKLSGIAALRAREIAQVWSHSRPDGRNFTSALLDYGYGYSAAAENLVHSTAPSAEAIAAKWMNTDSQTNILSGEFTTAGIGVYSAGGVTYIANILVG